MLLRYGYNPLVCVAVPPLSAMLPTPGVAAGISMAPALPEVVDFERKNGRGIACVEAPPCFSR